MTSSTTTSPALLTPDRARTLNALGLIAISAVLAFAFYDQFVGRDLPCPLCILQRAGFAGVGVGLALNVRFGPRPSHYAVAMLSAIIGGFVSTRQVLLHIVPGTGTYGTAFMGLHFYSWAVILSMIIVGGCVLLLMFDRQFERSEHLPSKLAPLALGAFTLALILTLGNGVSTVLECGGGLCPDNPADYMLLEEWMANPHGS